MLVDHVPEISFPLSETKPSTVMMPAFGMPVPVAWYWLHVSMAVVWW